MDIKSRIKNPWFWVGICSVAIAASGVDPNSFTSWSALWDGIVSVANNPVQLAAVFTAILSVFVDPTTNGLMDGDKANKED